MQVAHCTGTCPNDKWGPNSSCADLARCTPGLTGTTGTCRLAACPEGAWPSPPSVSFPFYYPDPTGEGRCSYSLSQDSASVSFNKELPFVYLGKALFSHGTGALEGTPLGNTWRGH